MKSFRQIADENNLNRTTIFKRAKKIPNFKAKHLTKKNGKWFVNDSGVKLLISHKNVRPRKYHSRINTKYDYWKRAKFLEDQNEWLRSRMDKLMANNTQLTKNNQKLANRPRSNQKQLTAKKSKPQKKLPMGVSYHYDLDVENSNLRNKNSEQAKQIARLKQQLNDSKHPILSRLFNHKHRR